METQDKKSTPKEIGSNLTGTALRGKPGHERDIDAETFKEEPQAKDPPDHHIANTDALLGDVHPTSRNSKSQEQHNRDQEKRT